MTKAWIKFVHTKLVINVESTIFPGHKTTLPLTFGSVKQAAAYCRKWGHTIEEGECPLPPMPQGRPTRDTATKLELRTLMRDDKGD